MGLLDVIGMGVSTGLGFMGQMAQADAYKNASEKNYQLQAENLAWQKSQQAESWKRDDTAVQRRAADMSAAGINPLLAAGSAAGNSPVVHTQAPQMDARAVAGASVGAKLSMGAERSINALSMSKDFAIKDGQAQLLQAQARGANAEAEYKEKLTPGAAGLQESQTNVNLANISHTEMQRMVLRANNIIPLSEAQHIASVADKFAESALSKVQAHVNAQQYESSYQRARATASSELITAGFNKQIADALAAQYAADILKNDLTVSGATVPGRIAGAYADVASKLGSTAASLKLSDWLRTKLVSSINQ